MAASETVFNIKAQVEGLSEIEGLKKSVQQLSNVATPSAESLNQLRKAALELGNAHKASERDIQTAINVLKDVKQQTAIASGEYKLMGRELHELENRLSAVTGSFNTLTSAQNRAAASAQGVSNVFDLSGRRINRGTTQYSSPIGPQQLNYASTNAALDAMQAAENQMSSLQRRAKSERLHTATRYYELELEANQKFWNDELRQNELAFQKELKEFDTRLNNRAALTARRQENMRAVGQTATMVAAAGLFGGPDAAIGTAAGGIVGAAFGPQGALTGAAIGGTLASAADISGKLKATTDYVTELNLAKMTLAQASASQAEYNTQLAAARRISNDYAVGLQDTIKGYAQISVAAKANGLSLADTEKIYRSAIATGVAFGKTQDDLNAIILATTQVLSKGKVSAEELSGQIGERIPGAVAKFAEATGRTMPQLAKDLQEGKVSIADFVEFSKKQYIDYDRIAQVIGASPEKAGARLQNALNMMMESWGGFFQKLGAGFQDNAAKFIWWVNTFSEGIKRLVTQVINTYRLISDPKFAANFGKQLEKKGFNKLNWWDLGGQFNVYTSNYQDYFSEFKPTEFGKGGTGMAGDLAGGAGSTKSSDAAARKAQALADKYLSTLNNARDFMRSIGEKIGKTFWDDQAIGAEGVQRAIVSLNQAQIENGKTLADLAAKYRDFKIERDKLKREGKDTAQIDIVLAATSDLLKQYRTSSMVKVQNDFTQSLLSGLPTVINYNTRLAEQAALFKANLEGRKELTEVEKLNLAIAAIPGLQSLIDTNDQLREQIRLRMEAAAAVDAQTAAAKNRSTRESLQEKINSVKDQLKELTKPINQIMGAAESIGASFSDAFKNVVSGASTAQQALAGFFKSIADYFLDMAGKIIAKWIEMAILNTVLSLFPGGRSGGSIGPSADIWAGINKYSANGNVFSYNGLVPYAMGGIVDRPTIFPFANGGAGRLGLMGEAGPEAIIPLRRGPDGRLGVSAGGGGGAVNVTVNVDASGSKVQGDAGQGAALGRAVSQAVQAELVKQKRPGGLLAS